MTKKTEELERRVERLEEEVDQLHSQLEETQDKGTQTLAGKRDRYDGAVLAKLEVGNTYHLNDLRTMYERAGIRDGKKIKDRIKHFDRSGLLETTGTQRWRFVGEE